MQNKPPKLSNLFTFSRLKNAFSCLLWPSVMCVIVFSLPQLYILQLHIFYANGKITLLPYSVSVALCAHAEIPQTPTTNRNRSHTIRQDGVGVFMLLWYEAVDTVLHKFYCMAIVDSNKSLSRILTLCVSTLLIFFFWELIFNKIWPGWEGHRSLHCYWETMRRPFWRGQWHVKEARLPLFKHLSASVCFHHELAHWKSLTPSQDTMWGRKGVDWSWCWN